MGAEITTDLPGGVADAVLSDGHHRRPVRGLRRRMLRHYLPIGLGGSLVLVLFMNLPFFDANRYPHAGDIFASGIKAVWESAGGSDMDMSDMDHGSNPVEAQTPAGADQSEMPQPEHQGGGAQPAMPPGGQHGGGQTGPPATEPAAGQSDGSPSATTDMDMSDRGNARLMRQYSVATGYIALALLAVTLLIGPANLMLRRRVPLSSYIARDVGIWATIASAAHVVFGFLVDHADGVLGYFFQPGDRSRILTTSFGLANWAGLFAVLLVAILAITSSDAALRRLKYRRWKRIQRLNYALFALVIAHALLYGALARLSSPYTALLGVSVAAVVMAQAIGIRLWRTRRRRTTAAA